MSFKGVVILNIRGGSEHLGGLKILFTSKGVEAVFFYPKEGLSFFLPWGRGGGGGVAHFPNHVLGYFSIYSAQNELYIWFL